MKLFSPNHTSVTVCVLKPHTLAKSHGTKSTLAGFVPQQNHPLLLLTGFFRFSIYTNYQVAFCLLQRVLHTDVLCESEKPQPLSLPYAFL